MSRVKESEIVYKNEKHTIKVYYETIDKVERVVKTECNVDIFRIDENYETLFQSQKLHNEKLDGVDVCLYGYTKPSKLEDGLLFNLSMSFSMISSEKTDEIIEKLNKGEWILQDVWFGDKKEGREDSFTPVFYIQNDDGFIENNKITRTKTDEEKRTEEKELDDLIIDVCKEKNINFVKN